MSGTPYQQLDVFTDRAGGGNPLGVVLNADAWSSVDMQRFAAWTDLVETTFLLTPSNPTASYRVRIFTPSKEIPFSGHPSIGSAHAALEAGLVAIGGRLVQECAAGMLPILVEGEGKLRRLFVQAPRASVLQQGMDAEPILQSLLAGVCLGALAPALIEGGRRWWMAEFADEPSVRNWQPDHQKIAALAAASQGLGLCVFARCVNDFDLVVRAFPAGVGIVEDPASGAANGLIAAYLAQSEPNGPLARGYSVSQGREMGHDARIMLRMDADGAVWVGGQTHTVLRGSVEWELLN